MRRTVLDGWPCLRFGASRLVALGAEKRSANRGVRVVKEEGDSTIPGKNAGRVREVGGRRRKFQGSIATITISIFMPFSASSRRVARMGLFFSNKDDGLCVCVLIVCVHKYLFPSQPR